MSRCSSSICLAERNICKQKSTAEDVRSARYPEALLRSNGCYREGGELTVLFFRAFLASMPLVQACRRITASLFRFHSFLAWCPLSWACSTMAAFRFLRYWSSIRREQICACNLAKPCRTCDQRLAEGCVSQTCCFFPKTLVLSKVLATWSRFLAWSPLQYF